MSNKPDRPVKVGDLVTWGECAVNFPVVCIRDDGIEIEHFVSCGEYCFVSWDGNGLRHADGAPISQAAPAPLPSIPAFVVRLILEGLVEARGIARVI